MYVRVHHQQPDPRVRVGRVRVPGERDGHPDQPALTARQQHLRVRMRQLLGQRRRHLLRPDVVRVREVPAEGHEVTVGGVQGGEFGQEGRRDVVVGGEGEGGEEHAGQSS